MPKISDEKRAARRTQILEAAWTCFQKEGLHATTMDDIIRASGLSAGAVYSYYPSKDDLILAAVTSSLSGLRALMQPLLDAQPPPAPAELLRQITATIARFTARDGYDATVPRTDAATALLAAVLGFVVQSAILGDVEPAEIAGGLAVFAASGRL